MFLKLHTIEVPKLIGEDAPRKVQWVRADLIRSVAQAEDHPINKKYGVNSVIAYGDLSPQYLWVNETPEQILETLEEK